MEKTIDKSGSLTSIQIQLLAGKKRDIVQIAIKLCGVFILMFILGFASPLHRVFWMVFSLGCALGVCFVSWILIKRIDRHIKEVTSIE